jgi:multisubunit Na+/H+ antiporter MnhF subunit
MEHKTIGKEVVGAKRVLTIIAGISAVVSVIAAVIRVIAGSQMHDYSHPIIGFLGVCMILGLFVALLAFNTRLQVAFDEAENRSLAEEAEG